MAHGMKSCCTGSQPRIVTGENIETEHGDPRTVEAGMPLKQIE